ncbi:MAG: DUF1987 domain-containing protein [Bacteroidales bacterium]|nr:DUF1987 domain-containing protein [Bacteroidales bacterium]
MNDLIIEATEETPKIFFKQDKNEFCISERSLPENAVEFYTPIFEWLEKYKNKPNSETIFDFKLDYFNTASAKQITKLLLLLEGIEKSNKVKIRWFFKKGDLDMKSSGLRYDKLIDINFELIEY